MDQLQDSFRNKIRSHLYSLRQELEAAGLAVSEKAAQGELSDLLKELHDLFERYSIRIEGVPVSNKIPELAQWEWDPASNRVKLNADMLRLIGLDESSELSSLERMLQPVFYPDREKFHKTLKDSYTSGMPFNIYYRITKSDNTMRFLHSQGNVLKNDEGFPQRMVATVKDVTEQMIGENKYHILLETAPDAIITTDAQGKIKEWNQKASEYFGWLHAEVKGRNFADLLFTQFFKATFDAGFDHYIRTGDTSLVTRKTEVQAVRDDGSHFPADVTISAVKIGSEHVFMIFIRDISEQKHGQILLREKEEQYRAVVESLFEGLIITDTFDRITYVNSCLEQLTGYKAEELIGRIEYEVFHPKALYTSVKSRMEKRLKGNSETYEMPFIRKDGTSFTGRINAAPFRNAAGKIIGTVGAITDITAQKREAELEKLVVAATKSFNSVLITDRQGYIEWVNEGFTKFTGYTIEDVKGTKGEILKRPDDTGFADHFQLFETVVKRKEPVTFESRNITKNGAEFWSITTLTPVLNDLQEVEKIISIDSDITLRKKMEEQLKLANRIAENSLIKGNKALSELTLAKQRLEETMRAKEQFLAHISHEIRTPMNGIIGLTDLLLKTQLTTEQREYLNAIKSSGDTLLVVINDILDLSKIEAGRMTFEKIPFKITSIINSILDLFHPKSLEKKIAITKQVSPKIPTVLIGDPIRVNQIIMNLVSNAVKFTDKGKVEIILDLVRETEEAVELNILVKDSGPGIPKEKLHTLFMDFTQVSLDITRKYGGTGLGLAISKRLVELQGGSVAVSSEVGVGSEFSIRLTFDKPLYQQLQENEIHQSVEYYDETLADLNGARVLLVEDNAVNQLLAEKLLSDWGCLVTSAENGKIAIEKLEHETFDLILMDIKMPEMDGYEATMYIRQNMNNKQIPIIALTAHAAIWEAEKCIGAGMNGYISKPFNIKELHKMISGNLNRSDSENRFPGQGQNNLPGDNNQYTDLTFLRSISKGNNEFMVKIINSFINQTSEELKKLETTLSQQDWTGVHAAAHKIKPSFHFVGLTVLKEPIATIEKYAKERVNLEAVPPLVDQILNVCNKAIAELKEELNKIS